MITYTDDQVQDALDKAPEAIQNTLSNGAALDFIINLSSRYGLHVDTAGSLSILIRNLVLGLLSPAEFPGELAALGIDTVTASKITTDLNADVFIPLNELIRNGGTDQSAVPATVSAIPANNLPVAEIRPRQPELVPVPSLVAPEQPLTLREATAAPITLPGSPVLAPMPQVQPIQATAVPPTLIPQAPASAMPDPAAVRAVMAGMEHNGIGHPAAMPNQYQPHPGWQPAAAVHLYVPTQQHPAYGPAPQQPQPMYAQPSQAMVMPYPEHIVHEQIPAIPAIPAYEAAAAVPPIAPLQAPVPPVPVITSQAPQAPAPQTEAPVTRNYPLDPYRESV